jgi:isocitrate dehydrogenase
VTDTDLAGASVATIIYTRTDEAPLLATYSLLPIIAAFTSTAGVRVETRDISLAGRILASSRPADRGATPDGCVGRAGCVGEDAGGEHHQAAQHFGVGAAVKAAVAELQSQGFDLPDYPDSPVHR